MEKRKLGNSGLQVSPFCLGCNVFGWTADQPTSFRLLDAFVDAGFEFVDTADTYSTWVPGHSGGESETIVGNWFRHSGKRAKVILATKVGKPMGPDKKGLSNSYILRAIEDSLRRLQTDYIDLYQSHEDDPQTPLEETLEAFTRLVKSGKVRAIGASNYSGSRLALALEASKQNGYARYECLQPNYSLVERADYEQHLEPVCVKNSLGVIPYFSLGSGFLTGKYRTAADPQKSARGAFVKKYMNDRGMRVLHALDQVSARYQSTPARVALAWLMARPSVTAPIASATKVEQLHDLLEATKLGLDASAIESLSQASAWS